MKKPPFARQLRDQRDIRIFCGGEHVWKRAKYWNDTGGDRIGALALPEPNPEAYDWRVVLGRECTVIQVDAFSSTALERLGALLVQAGADRVVIIYVTAKGMRLCGFTGGYDLAIEEPESGWLK